MKRNLYCFIAFFALFFTLASCARDWQDPDSAISAQSISIATLITNRQAYASAGVSLIGKVWNLETGSVHSQTQDGSEQTYTTFILADRMGTGIDVYAPGDVAIEEGDFVRVVGIYRKEFQRTGDYFLNVVDAVRIEEWNPSLGYWMREFEWD